MRELPHPVGTFFTIEAAALALGVTRRTIYNLISVHRASLDRPIYRQLRRPRDPRLYRLLSDRDFGFLRTLFPVRVR